MSSTSSSNFRRNKAEINMFRKELEAMVDDIEEIDRKVITKAVNEGLKVAKQKTPVGNYSKKHRVIKVRIVGTGKDASFDMGVNRVGGFMRKSWHSPRAQKTPQGVEKELYNSADYSPFVNYGHRLVNKAGETTGFVKGQFMLEKGISHTEKTMKTEFEKEVERVNREHDK
jgi:Bacteriophage protein of unknown function (DUF646).